jgi:hypothetical protein
MVCAERTIGWEIIFTHPMVLLYDLGQVEGCFGTFGDSVISTQDRCMVCAERTIGWAISLDTHDGTPT